jgi:hypothetical protein
LVTILLVAGHYFYKSGYLNLTMRAHHDIPEVH